MNTLHLTESLFLFEELRFIIPAVLTIGEINIFVCLFSVAFGA